MKKNILLITGGTGGHVIPAENFYNYLVKQNIDCKIMVDQRGKKYIKIINDKIKIIKSSNLSGNFILKIYGFFNLIIGFIKSFFVILYLKPDIVISFGSYASFFPMISCIILKRFYNIKIFIHEQNTILGRTNSFFAGFAEKLFLNFDISLKLKQELRKKIYVVGSPENENIDSTYKKNELKDLFTIFITGGSQGSEFISKFATNLIKRIDKEKSINVKFIMQCPKHLIKHIEHELINIRSPLKIKEYFYNIDEILKNTSLSISRAGAGTIRDLINYEIPSILIPLPTSKDNHQFHNASIMSNNQVAIIINQKKNEINKAKEYIDKIYNSSYNFNKEGFKKIKVKNTNSLIYKLISK